MVTKKQRKNITIIVLILLVVGIVAYSNSSTTLGIPPISPPTGCKSSVLNLDEVSIVRDEPGVDNDIYQVILSGRDAGQCVFGYLEKEELKSKIKRDTGKDVEFEYSKPIGISIERTKSEAWYRIADTYQFDAIKYRFTSNPIHTYSDIITGGSYLACRFGVPVITDKCSKRCGDEGIGYSFENCEFRLDGKTDCFCWDDSVRGRIYDTSQNKLNEELKVQVATGDGKFGEILLNRLNTEDTWEEDLFASFEGFLQGWSLVPNAESVLKGSGDDKVVRDFAGLLHNCEDKIDWDIIESCMLAYNLEFDRLTVTPPEFNDAYIDEPYVKLPLSEDTFFPIVKVQVKAAWLGIYEPLAVPEFINCEDLSLEFRNKKTASLIYNLKIKQGTGTQGTFQIFTSCSGSGVSVMPEPSVQTIVGQDVVSGEVKATQTSNSDFTSSCQVKASITRLGFTSEDICYFDIKGSSSCALEAESCNVESDCCEGLRCEVGFCRKKPGVEICYNLRDDDGDNLIDCKDPDCKESIYCDLNEICDNQIDDDGDGLIDLEDPDCQGSSGTCTSCFSWFSSLFKSENEKCEPQTYFERKWWNPFTWWVPQGGITQSTICPIYLIGVGLVVILTIMILFRLSQGFKLNTGVNRRR